SCQIRAPIGDQKPVLNPGAEVPDGDKCRTHLGVGIEAECMKSTEKPLNGVSERNFGATDYTIYFRFRNRTD
ncbi:MAG: hypothetical protein U5J63_06170, partial [Fodinibius sp.]|nr:hypothetical protein [Fodinibius sp.]